MNSVSWLFLNALLIFGAILSTITMRSIAVPELPAIEARENAGKDSKGGKNDSPPQDDQLSPQPRTLTMDDIWEKSLFRPDRTEKTESAEADDNEQQTAEKSDFELTGIAWMGLPGQAKPVAVIKQRQTLPPRRTTTRRVIGGRRIPQPAGPAHDSDEANKALNVVFAVGDAINDTGYILIEINIEENSAVLKKNAERVELKIDFGNDASLQRKTAAVNEASTRQKQREAAETQTTAAKLAVPVASQNAPGGVNIQPPGPPGGPGSPASPPTRPQPQPGGQVVAPASPATPTTTTTSQNEKLRQRLEMLNRSTRRSQPQK